MQTALPRDVRLCLRSVSVMPPFCLRSVSVLSPFCLRSVSVLSPFCLRACTTCRLRIISSRYQNGPTPTLSPWECITCECKHAIQGYLARQKMPSPLGPPNDPRHRSTIGSQGCAFSYKRFCEVPLYTRIQCLTHSASVRHSGVATWRVFDTLGRVLETLGGC